jgi:drug/metabolite transporter (DMT)-like permease
VSAADAPPAALYLAGSSMLFFGAALVTGRFALRSLDARSGAAISLPTGTLLFLLVSPFVLDPSEFVLHAALLFALVGTFFPAVVTVITFEANQRLGPTLTGTISSTAPLFAMVAAALLLGEHIPARAALASAGIVAGVGLLTWKAAEARSAPLSWSLALPLLGAILRGVAHALARAGLLLWPNPYAASLIGYTVSSAAVLAAERLPRADRMKRNKRGVAWFVLTGVLNSGALLLMYAALARAPVAFVAPIVAAFPLVTVFLGAAVLREEKLSVRSILGAALTVASIAYLVMR